MKKDSLGRIEISHALLRELLKLPSRFEIVEVLSGQNYKSFSVIIKDIQGGLYEVPEGGCIPVVLLKSSIESNGKELF